MVRVSDLKRKKRRAGDMHSPRLFPSNDSSRCGLHDTTPADRGRMMMSVYITSELAGASNPRLC